MYTRDDFDESFTSAANVDDGMAWQRVQVGKSTEERSLLVAAMVKIATVTRIIKYNKYDEDQDVVDDDDNIQVDRIANHPAALLPSTARLRRFLDSDDGVYHG